MYFIFSEYYSSRSKCFRCIITARNAICIYGEWYGLNELYVGS